MDNEKPSPSATHTFNRAAERTIADAMAISNQRAGEYHDSWSLENLRTSFLDNLLRDFPVCPKGMNNPNIDKEYKRLIVMASMVDIKVSRMGGGWKKDTSIDLINYTAAYCELREQFGRAFGSKDVLPRHPEHQYTEGALNGSRTPGKFQPGWHPEVAISPQR